MTVNHQKSTAVTNLDATPPLRPTSGEGGVGIEKTVEAAVALTASGAQYSTVQLARVPSNVIIKEIELLSPSQGTTGIFDVGAYYATDGSKAGAATVLADDNTDAIDADFFIDGADAGGQAVFVHAIPGGGFKITSTTPAILSNAAWTAAKANQPLWQALGLSADPKCNIDIVASLTDEAAGTGAATVYARVKFISP